MNKLMSSLGLAGIAAGAMIAVAAQAGPISPDPMQGLPVKGVRNVAITVSDIDATVAFYAKAAPYRVVKRYFVKGEVFDPRLLSRPHKRIEIALIATPTTFIQLMDFDPGKAQRPSPRPLIGPGYTHICFQSPAANSAYDRFRSSGLAMISRGDKPVDIGGYGIRYAYGRDPDGIMIENEVYDYPKRQETAWVSHIANVVHDRDAMLSFYTKVFGVGPHSTVEQERRKALDDIADIDNLSIRGGWFSLGNFEIEVWQYVRPQTPAPRADKTLDQIGYNAFSLEVLDLPSEVARLGRLGVRLAGKPIRQGGWLIQYAYDPEGNLFTVQQNLKAGRGESINDKVWIARPKG